MAHFVEALAEIPNQKIPAHLEFGHRTLKILLAALAKPGHASELEGVPFVLGGKLVHHPLLTQTGQLLVSAAVKVVAIPPPVGKVGKPLLGDEPGLPAEELAVSHLAAAGNELPPLPGTFLRISAPPVEVGGVLLGGEAVNLVFKQRQKTNLIDSTVQLLPAVYAVGVVPIQPQHDPFAVFNGHGVTFSSSLLQAL